MPVELNFTAICRNNQIFIMDGLSADEFQTGRKLHEDIVDYGRTINRINHCSHFKIKSKTALVGYLKAMETECKAGVLMPHIHFECHGDEYKGLWLAGSGEFIPWPELASLIAPLNAASRNNLSVMLATCHGYQLAKGVNVKDPCPFHFMIAPNEEISAGAIYDSALPFYKEVISTGELNTALGHLDNRFKRFIAGEWFYTMVASFYINNYGAKARAAMVEEMVDNEVKSAGHHNRQLVRASRARAKKHLANPQNFYNTMCRSFFHGQIQIPYEEMRKFVDHHKSIR